MKIGIVKEIKESEYRVGAVPPAVILNVQPDFWLLKLSIPILTVTQIGIPIPG